MRSVLQTIYYSSQSAHKKEHFHDCHQIILVVKGKAAFRINDKYLVANEGSIAIFSRYENHSVVTGLDEYERFVLHIDPNIVNRKSAVYSLLTDRPADFCNIIDVSQNMTDITEIFKKILSEHNGTSKLADEMEQLLLEQLLISIYRCTSFNFDDTYDDIVVGIKRQFENDYCKPYTLDMLSKQYSVSVSSLSHRFQETTGVSVMEYLQSCRMANAKQMLAETELSIGEIVERCGFSDSSNFSRAFKKRNECSPSDFRKRYLRRRVISKER